ncbi:MAG TPA: hypothetical protein VN329_07520, partial [Roseomonas sp.]|nr:hypothetical protein [Roseomonas sp.]
MAETGRTGTGGPLGQHPRIAKRLDQLRVQPNLVGEALAGRRFDWAEARALLDGLPSGRGLNIAHEAVDRHAAGPQGG